MFNVLDRFRLFLKSQGISRHFKRLFVNENFTQLVSVYTWSPTVANGAISRSCISHIPTNVPDKCSVPVVSSAGDSAHLATLETKYTRQ